MKIVTLHLRPQGNWIGDLSRDTGITVSVERCMKKSKGQSQSYLRILSSDKLSEEELREDIKALRPDCQLELTKVKPGEWVATAEIEGCQLCCALTSSECILETAYSFPDGSIEWVLIAPDSGAVQALVDCVRELGCEVELIRSHSLNGVRLLTSHQQKAIRLAYELGYFDIPKRITLEKLAQRLEISKPTLDIMLRRAQRKLIAQHMSEG